MAGQAFDEVVSVQCSKKSPRDVSNVKASLSIILCSLILSTPSRPSSSEEAGPLHENWLDIHPDQGSRSHGAVFQIVLSRVV